MPLSGRVARILIFGGGGCGKTRIINEVLTPLFRRFYGLRGCVLTAFSNKAARLIKGKTSHALTKLYGEMSLTMARLRITPWKKFILFNQIGQTILGPMLGPFGGLVGGTSWWDWLLGQVGGTSWWD